MTLLWPMSVGTGNGSRASQPLGEIESTKSVSDVYAPVSGVVVENNSDCRDNPAVVNQDPYGEGWLVVLQPADAAGLDDLLSAEEYERFLVEEAGEDALSD